MPPRVSFPLFTSEQSQGTTNKDDGAKDEQMLPERSKKSYSAMLVHGANGVLYVRAGGMLASCWVQALPYLHSPLSTLLQRLTTKRIIKQTPLKTFTKRRKGATLAT